MDDHTTTVYDTLEHVKRLTTRIRLEAAFCMLNCAGCRHCPVDDSFPVPADPCG